MSPTPSVSSTFFIAMICLQGFQLCVHWDQYCACDQLHKVFVRHGHHRCDQRRHLWAPNPNVFSCVFFSNIHRVGTCVQARARLGCPILFGCPFLASCWLYSLRCLRGHRCCASLPIFLCSAAGAHFGITGSCRDFCIAVRLITGFPAALTTQVRLYPWRKDLPAISFQPGKNLSKHRVSKRAVIQTQPTILPETCCSSLATRASRSPRSLPLVLSRPPPCVLLPRHTSGPPTVQPSSVLHLMRKNSRVDQSLFLLCPVA